MTSKKASKRVLAIDPVWGGFGYAVMEGPERLVNWGLKGAKEDRRVRSVNQVAGLLKRFDPQVLVVEDISGGLRHLETRDLIADFVEIARERKIEAVFIRRQQVLKHFAPQGTVSLEDIAAVLAKDFPGLAHRLPAPRKPWKHEARSIRIFSSIALALTYYAA